MVPDDPTWSLTLGIPWCFPLLSTVPPCPVPLDRGPHVFRSAYSDRLAETQTVGKPRSWSRRSFDDFGARHNVRPRPLRALQILAIFRPISISSIFIPCESTISAGQSSRSKGISSYFTNYFNKAILAGPFGHIWSTYAPCPLSLALKVIKNWQVFEFLPWPTVSIVQFRSRNANPLTWGICKTLSVRWQLCVYFCTTYSKHSRNFQNLSQ